MILKRGKYSILISKAPGALIRDNTVFPEIRLNLIRQVALMTLYHLTEDQSLPEFTCQTL